jgi:Peptidase family M23
MHEGIDLLAPIGTPVFAAAGGSVIEESNTSLLILHNHGFRYLTFYQHLQNKTVTVGNPVVAGQRIAEVGDFPGSTEDHLHFEIRYPFDAVNTTYNESIPVDPTMVLYNWEEKNYQNDSAVRQGHIFDNVLISNIEVVRRNRLLSFLLVSVEGQARDLYVPLNDQSPLTQEIISSLKQAFFSKCKVRIVWRDSLYFRGIQSTLSSASIIAEVKIYKP